MSTNLYRQFFLLLFIIILFVTNVCIITYVETNFSPYQDQELSEQYYRDSIGVGYVSYAPSTHVVNEKVVYFEDLEKFKTRNVIIELRDDEDQALKYLKHTKSLTINVHKDDLKELDLLPYSSALSDVTINLYTDGIEKINLLSFHLESLEINTYENIDLASMLNIESDRVKTISLNNYSDHRINFDINQLKLNDFTSSLSFKRFNLINTNEFRFPNNFSLIDSEEFDFKWVNVKNQQQYDDDLVRITLDQVDHIYTSEEVKHEFEIGDRVYLKDYELKMNNLKDVNFETLSSLRVQTIMLLNVDQSVIDNMTKLESINTIYVSSGKLDLSPLLEVEGLSDISFNDTIIKYYNNAEVIYKLIKKNVKIMKIQH